MQNVDSIQSMRSCDSCKPVSIFLILTGIACLSSPCLYAQQNLFNVPSTEITEADHYFFQQQFNFLSTSTSNTTIDYGLGNSWEIGLNLFNVTLYSNSQDQWSNPLFLANFQKGIELTPNWKIGFGTQSGLSLPAYNKQAQFASFNYLNNAFNMGTWGKYYLGVYYANYGYVGSGTKAHMMAGIDLSITESVHLIADFIGGNNNLSTAVTGLVWQATPHWQFSLGAQLPTPEKDGHEYGVVFEITRL